MRQLETKVQAWCEELITLGYGPPLLASTHSVQATIAVIDVPEFHTYIQESNLMALNDADEEGQFAPLLVDTLDSVS